MEWEGNPLRRTTVIAMFAALVLVGAACGSDPELEAARAGGPRRASVEAIDNVFQAKTVEVGTGGTVEWRNDGHNVHDIVPVDAKTWGITASRFQPGASYSTTFSRPGVYAYYCSIHGTPTSGMRGVIVVGGAQQQAADRTDTKRPAGPPTTIRVPQDATTIQAGVDRARPGDLVLVSPGVYKEAVTVDTPQLTIRGVDRNRTVLEGEFKRDHGVRIVGADGVAVENLTARDYRYNGFFWTGVTGYRGSYLSTTRTGDYGVYAFDSKKGQFDHDYASGAPDAGFYIGQCQPCDAVITDVVSEYNGLGYSGTNAGGNLIIANSIWRHNRAGIVPNSGSYERGAPQRGNVIVGNLVYSNNNGTSPAIDAAKLAQGNGILVAGGQDDVIERNQVWDHDLTGIAVITYPELDKDNHVWPAAGNRVEQNAVSDSRLADLALYVQGGAAKNCFSGNRFATSAPAAIEQAVPCTGTGTGDVTTGGFDLLTLIQRDVPDSVDYRTAPTPPIPEQPQMPGAASAGPHPATDVPMAIDVDAIALPPRPAGT